MNLIDEKKLAELQEMWRSDPEYNLEDGNMTRVFDTLSLALKVVRAAQEIKPFTTGVHDWKGDPKTTHYIVPKDDLCKVFDSLAPFSEQEKEKR